MADHLSLIDVANGSLRADLPQAPPALHLGEVLSSALPADTVPRPVEAGPGVPLAAGIMAFGPRPSPDYPSPSPGAVGNNGATLVAQYRPAWDDYGTQQWPGALDRAHLRTPPTTAASAPGPLGKTRSALPWAYDYPVFSDLEVRDALLAAGA